MPVKDADPQAVQLDDAFRAAMDAPAKPREAAPPPEIDPDAPHGRGEDGAPLAPYGFTREGKPKRTAAGRKPRDEQPRTGEVVKPPAGRKGEPAPAPPPADYTGALGELADSVWLGISGLSMVGPHIPVVGKFLPEQKLQAEAWIWRSNQPRVVKAMQVASQHNAKAARTCAKLATGDITWVLTVGVLVMPLLAQSAAVFKGDAALREMNEDASLQGLAELNQAHMDAYMTELAEVAKEAAAEAMAEASPNGAQPAGM